MSDFSVLVIKSGGLVGHGNEVLVIFLSLPRLIFFPVSVSAY